MTYSPQYEHLEHTADIRIRVQAQDLKSIFKLTAEALMHLTFGDELAHIHPLTRKTIIVEAKDRASLLIAWLSELLCLSSSEYIACCAYDFKEFSDKRIVAEVGVSTAQAQDEIKAVTHHQLKLEEENNAWVCEITFDI